MEIQFPYANYQRQVSKATTYQMLVSDDAGYFSGSAFTATLPDATARGARPVLVKKTDSAFANIITISAKGTDTIEGAASIALYTLDEAYLLVPIGTTWHVLSHSYSQVPVTWAPALSNFGTVTNNNYFYFREGCDFVFWGSHTNGTVVAALGSIALPAGLTIATASVAPAGNTTAAAGMRVGEGWGNAAANSFAPLVLAPGTSTSLIYTGNTISGTNCLVPGNASNAFTTSGFTTLRGRVPITGWS